MIVDAVEGDHYIARSQYDSPRWIRDLISAEVSICQLASFMMLRLSQLRNLTFLLK